LSAHAKGAGFTGVATSKSFIELKKTTDFSGFAKNIEDCRPTASGGNSWLCHSEKSKTSEVKLQVAPGGSISLGIFAKPLIFCEFLVKVYGQELSH
jgi:hypothetical protein